VSYNESGCGDMQWACDAGSGHAEEGRILGPSVRLPGQADAHHQDPVLGRQVLAKVAFSLARVCAAMSSASCSKHRFAFKSFTRFPGSRQSVWCSRLQLPPMRSRVGFRIGAWLVSAQGSVRSTKARKANPYLPFGPHVDWSRTAVR